MRIKLSTLLKQLIFTISGTIYSEWDKHHQAFNLMRQQSRHGLKKNSLKHKKKIVNKAFYKMGVRDPLYIKFDANMDAAKCDSFFNWRLQRSAFVTINPNLNDQALYAVAGHEAAHHLHAHTFIQTCIQWSWFSGAMLFRFPNSIPYLSTACLVFPYINRKLEAHADMTSAKRLNTTNELIQLFKSWDKPDNGIGEKIIKGANKMFGSHPSLSARITYLGKLSTTNSTKFPEQNMLFRFKPKTIIPNEKASTVKHSFNKK